MDENGKKRRKLSRREFVKGTVSGLSAAGLGASAFALAAASTEAAQVPRRWDKSADVVIVGAGATGIPAAIEAAQNGASVIIVEQNYDIGGHAIQSGCRVALGGGTSMQKRHGVEDSPDRMFEDLVNWFDYRFSDREIIRSFCDWSAPTYEWLVANGVPFDPESLEGADGGPQNIKRSQRARWRSGVNATSPTGANGTLLMRPLEVSARKLGVQILLQHSMTGVIREQNFSGRVFGVLATNEGKSINIQARKGVILGTGGHSSNVLFRRMFDARLTEEYQVVGEPYSRQSGDAEMVAVRIGASLWGAANQTLETMARTHVLEKPLYIGNQYGYLRSPADPGDPGIDNILSSPIFKKMGATGLTVKDHQNVIHVNQVGRRIVNEMLVGPEWWNPCLAINGGTRNGGGPIWAIFDAEAVKRENWICEPPHVDPNGWFFAANSLEELAGKIQSKYQKQPLPGAALRETVARYNSFVESGKDADFGKPSPKYKFRTPPFYAGWSAPCVHDCLSGLRINTKSQVLDWNGEAIPGLYCGGESAGGFNQHGLAKCIVEGRIAGREAARSKPYST
jgi:urocanate reductase